MKRIAVSVLSVVLALGGEMAAHAASKAQTVLERDPLLRLAMPNQDKGEGSRNVQVYQVSYEGLPRFMKAQADIIAQCAGGEKFTEEMGYYAYVSDYNRANKLEPSYIIDTMALKDRDFSKCNLGEICQNSQCAIIGFISDIEGWTRSFFSPAYRWSFENAPQGKEGAPQVMWIHVLSMRDASCEMPFAAESEGGCFRRYEWRRSGLAPVPLDN